MLILASKNNSRNVAGLAALGALAINVADLLSRPEYVDKVFKQYGIKMIKPVLPYVSFD